MFFTLVCDSVNRWHAWQGGMCGRGTCVAREGAWQGVCMSGMRTCMAGGCV